MVFVWGWGGGRRRRRPGWGPGPGYGGGGPGYGGYGPGYGPGYGRRRGDDSCLRDLLFLNTGCCLAQSLGCGLESVLLAPRAARGLTGTTAAERLVSAVRTYQREVSAHRPPVCRFTPSCSAYAVEALETHGARTGTRLTLARLVRCRPGAAGGADPVPPGSAVHGCGDLGDVGGPDPAAPADQAGTG
ncbi:membrane protein insertion efficiency factor YidD [Klenkia terrae]|uniref:Putative membrane protein insertion efficiency factor n=1 Tax=Klenkia terrae TaxID=1052259 RepID=A0ABU8E2K4_9ACTN|nr:membrane protein insertion efficiency factor YidD [Klenkia terrae]SSC21499.1 Hypothetical protein KLENKIAIHU_68 [Klenkia terrae]